MEWSSAKKVVILLLLALNGVLFALNLQQMHQNSMTGSEERTVFEVLSEYGISLYTELLPDEEIMPRLTISVPEYTAEEISRQFFAGETVTEEKTEHGIRYTASAGSLVIQDGKGIYDPAQTGETISGLGYDRAVQAAQTFLKSIPWMEQDMVLDQVKQAETGFTVSFYGTYEQRGVFADWCKILVTENGVEQIEFTTGEITGFTGEEKEICRCDEALLTFLRSLQDQEKTPLTIERIELGYDAQEGEALSAGTQINLIPCYRIYVVEWDMPFSVNAYTGEENVTAEK